MIKMDNGNSACLMVTITDDDMVEDDETFEIQFTELGPSECNMDTGSGGSSGEDRDDLLSPMSSSEFENVLITIMDNDKPVTGGKYAQYCLCSLRVPCVFSFVYNGLKDAYVSSPELIQLVHY